MFRLVQRGVTIPRRCPRPLHTTVKREALPPFVVVIIKPVSRVLAVVIGRRFRKWWSTLEQEKKEAVKQKGRKLSRLWGGLGVFLTAFGIHGYASHIQECPITKRRRFVALTPDQMKAISGSEFEGLVDQLKHDIIPITHPAYGRVARVTRRIFEGNKDIKEIREKHWTISVVKGEERNAFVLPNGNMFVYTGMLDVCRNDDQLGFILSHEISHTLLNHGAENISHANLVSAVLLIPLAILWAFLPNDGIAIVADWFFNKITSIVLELPFSREMEAEADQVGLELAAKACFDVREAPAFWRQMHFISEVSTGQTLPEFLSTHPSHSTRHKELSELVPEAIKTRLTCNCQPLRGPDPDKELEGALLLKSNEPRYVRV